MKKYTITMKSAYVYPRYTSMVFTCNGEEETQKLWDALTRTITYQFRNHELDDANLETDYQYIK